MNEDDAAQLLNDAGEALYGPRWQTDMARDLDMSDRHLRRIIAGHSPLTASILADIRKIALERGRAIAALIKRLPEATK